MTERNYVQTVAAEVRAEMARQSRTLDEMAGVLGIKTRGVAKARYDGETPFDLREIFKVSDWLGVDVRKFTAAKDAA